MSKKSVIGAKWLQKSHHVLLHRNDDRQVEVKSKSCLLNKSFHTKTCHNLPDASLINTIKHYHCTSVIEGIIKPKNRECRHRMFMLRTSVVYPLFLP